MPGGPADKLGHESGQAVFQLRSQKSGHSSPFPPHSLTQATSKGHIQGHCKHLIQNLPTPLRLEASKCFWVSTGTGRERTGRVSLPRKEGQDGESSQVDEELTGKCDNDGVGPPRPRDTHHCRRERHLESTNLFLKVQIQK